MLKEISPAFQILGSTTVSGQTTYLSSVTNVLFKDSIGYQVNVQGNPYGVLNVNGSIDYNPGLPQTGGTYNPGNWTTIVGQTLGSGTLFPVLFNLNQIAAPWTQLQFVSSSSNGVISAYVVAKSLG